MISKEKFHSCQLFFKDSFQYVQHPFFTKLLPIGMGISLIGLTYIFLSLKLYETRAPKGIVYTSDNDVGRAIQTAGLTRWYNSNHFSP